MNRTVNGVFPQIAPLPDVCISLKTKTTYFHIKRAIDIGVSSILLVLISPLLLLIAIAIRMDSPGPLFYIQQRVSSRLVRRNGRMYWEQSCFPYYQFRTVKTAAISALDEAYLEAFSQRNLQVRKPAQDLWMTRVGRLLRKTRLDKLPQLWNVLRGDLSLVGPYPAIPCEVEIYETWHFQRLLAKPGLSGLWKVSARSSGGFDEMVRLDIQYIEQQCPGLDGLILLKTPLAIMRSFIA